MIRYFKSLSLITSILLISSNMIKLASQEISPSELITRSIDFHDPLGTWNTFNGSFQLSAIVYDSIKSETSIKLDLPSESFIYESVKNNETTYYKLEKDQCTLKSMGKMLKGQLGDSLCIKVKKYNDYYRFLLGLPMKLKDPGVKIAEKVETTTFQGHEYYSLVVDFESEISDGNLWTFYFDKSTSHLKAVQFYKRKDIQKKTGEFILFEDLITINQITIPQTRKWYYNKDSSLLAIEQINNLN